MVKHVIICNSETHAKNLCERWFKYIKEVQKREITQEIMDNTSVDPEDAESNFFCYFLYLSDPIWCESTACEFATESAFKNNQGWYRRYVCHSAEEIEKILEKAEV